MRGLPAPATWPAPKPSSARGARPPHHSAGRPMRPRAAHPMRCCSPEPSAPNIHWHPDNPTTTSRGGNTQRRAQAASSSQPCAARCYNSGLSRCGRVPRSENATPPSIGKPHKRQAGFCSGGVSCISSNPDSLATTFRTTISNHQARNGLYQQVLWHRIVMRGASA